MTPVEADHPALRTDFFGEDLFCPAQSRVCCGEAYGGKGEDDGVQDLLLGDTDAEQLADV